MNRSVMKHKPTSIGRIDVLVDGSRFLSLQVLLTNMCAIKKWTFFLTVLRF